jgi:hypothetical protein
VVDRSEPIPADLSEAFDHAVSAHIAWDGRGEEPTVIVHGKPTLISAVASLAEAYKDTMPTKLYWRMVHYANRSAERRSQAARLSKDSSYESGARCLLSWVEDNESKFGQQQP